MCLWATAPFLSCLRSLMDIDWNRSLKWNCLLLLTSLPVIQRLIYGVQQHLQDKQQQVKRLKGLSFWWRLFALIMILSFFFLIKCCGLTHRWFVSVKTNKSVKGTIIEGKKPPGNANMRWCLHTAVSFFPGLLQPILLSQEVVAWFWSVSGVQTGPGHSTEGVYIA